MKAALEEAQGRREDQYIEEACRLGVSLAESWEEAVRRAAEERVRRMREIRDIA